MKAMTTTNTKAKIQKVMTKKSHQAKHTRIFIAGTSVSAMFALVGVFGVNAASAQIDSGTQPKPLETTPAQVLDASGTPVVEQVKTVKSKQSGSKGGTAPAHSTSSEPSISTPTPAVVEVVTPEPVVAEPSQSAPVVHATTGGS